MGKYEWHSNVNIEKNSWKIVFTIFLNLFMNIYEFVYEYMYLHSIDYTHIDTHKHMEYSFTLGEYMSL